MSIVAAAMVLSLLGLTIAAGLRPWGNDRNAPAPPMTHVESARSSTSAPTKRNPSVVPEDEGAVAHDFWTSRYGGDPATAVALTCRHQMEGDVELTLAFDDDGVPTVPVCSPAGPHCDCLHDHLEAGPRSPDLAGRAAQLVVEGYPWSAAHEARLKLQLRLRRWFPDLSWALI
jgi:hypothetical protein